MVSQQHLTLNPAATVFLYASCVKFPVAAIAVKLMAMSIWPADETKRMTLKCQRYSVMNGLVSG
jgi:hypothetical protein